LIERNDESLSRTNENKKNDHIAICEALPRCPKETNLITKILSHAGVVVKDATVIQVAQGKEVFKEQKQSR